MKFVCTILVIAVVINCIAAMTDEEDFIESLHKRECITRNKNCKDAKNNCCIGLYCQNQMNKKGEWLCKENGTKPPEGGKGFHGGLMASGSSKGNSKNKKDGKWVGGMEKYKPTGKPL
ncbi:uncharacterized protein LOC135491968 [Lineus longissimus]|uniref:uncharacterized protein LOC135491968 n=1 Tax=Lineus longissimus TaxID=88925 RepID=UPI002B4D0703